MNQEIDRTVLLERVESLLLQIQELYRGIPSDAKGYQFVKSKLQSTIENLIPVRFDLKFTPQGDEPYPMKLNDVAYLGD